MRFISAQRIVAAVSFRDLTEVLRRSFRSNELTSDNLSQEILRPDSSYTTAHSVTSAWTAAYTPEAFEQNPIGTRLRTVMPQSDNEGRFFEAGAYLLSSSKDGSVLCSLDGPALSAVRDAGLSGLAASYLAREDAHTLVVANAEAGTQFRIQALIAQRPIKRIIIWDRIPDRAKKLAQYFNGPILKAESTSDLKEALSQADILCCSADSEAPFIEDAWIKRGCHIDVQAGHQPEFLSLTADAILRCRITVEDRDTLLACGDLAIPLQDDVLQPHNIACDLFSLCQGDCAGRRKYDQTTLFCAHGGVLADLKTANYVYLRV